MIKKIILIVFSLFLLIGCDNIKKEEKEILNMYEELSMDDYVNEYNYLDENNYVKSISYEDMLNMIKNEDFILYFGGSWCKNCQAAMPFIYEACKKSDTVIYNFDPRIGSNKERENDIRNCIGDARYNLYKRFIEVSGFKNLDGVKTEGTDLDRILLPTLVVFKGGSVYKYLAREYLYDGEILYIESDELKTDYSEAFSLELDSLFSLK